MLNFQEEKQQRRLDDLRSEEAEQLAVMLAKKYDLPYVDLSKYSINTDALRLIPEEEARGADIAAIKITGKNVEVAIASPANLKAQAVMNDLKGMNYSLTIHLCSEQSLHQAWEYYKEIGTSSKTTAGVIDISSEDIDRLIREFKNLDETKAAITAENKRATEGSGISGILEVILAGSLISLASDIHIEPEEQDTRLRYRLDGVLQDIVQINHKVYERILSRIKLISGLRLNVKLAAQDGRFSIKVADSEIEIRTSVLPGAYGESIVMRVLNPKSIMVSFEQLGIEPDLSKIMETEISKPNGLILLTGPTGSGKTTTLYAFLRKVNSTETKIITIEDPIEYHLKGVDQTQVNPKKGYSFLSGLRAALRQDPDIIMVGEIRDSETAKIAINSALTGHLVFSTLHTNNAAGTIPRLIDLGINPKIIGSSLTIAIAQRLVRKLCEHCKKEDAASAEEQKLIDAVVPTIKNKKPTIEIGVTNKVWRTVGCEICNHTGYKGRTGIYEAILIDEAINKAAVANPSEREIRIAALPQGILDMRQDGVIKILRGDTSMEELARVIDLSEEIL